MRRLAYILTIGCLLLGAISPSQAQDFARMGERTIMGTARYVGMGGAMSAIGADPSATMDNVAGLGLYRRPEVVVSFDYMSDKTVQLGVSNVNGRSRLFMAPNASMVLAFPTNKLSGVQYHNIQISYQRLHTFNRGMEPYAFHSPSLGALIAGTGVDMRIPFCADRMNLEDQLQLIESGYVNKYAFDWSMNISDRWYFGLGLNIYSFSMLSEGKYTEWFDYYSPLDKQYYNYSETKVRYDGAGVSLSTGLIYRPTRWFRLGFGLETPSVGSFHTATSGYFEAQADSVAFGSSSAPDLRSDIRGFHMPLHLSTSAAFQITNYALIALQYDYFHQSGEIAKHSLRAGLEVSPYPGVYLNAGYAYESPFRKNYPVVPMDKTLDRQDAYSLRTHRSHYISGAVGYRGRYFLVQAAYQYRLQRVYLYAHENVLEPYQLNAYTHRVVVTIGWHR